jgi:hypothetical protein
MLGRLTPMEPVRAILVNFVVPLVGFKVFLLLRERMLEKTSRTTTRCSGLHYFCNVWRVANGRYHTFVLALVE